MTPKLPSIVIVGRPNVGKSTLFNRLTGTRRSIVTNEPGITRDRIYGSAQWDGRAFEVVDTGGIVPEDKAGIPGEILRQARVAIENATRVVQIVDGRAGPLPLDSELAQLLRRAGKPPVIAVNKVDSAKQAELAAQFYELGDEIFPVSAEHGYGVDALLDALTQDFPQGESTAAPPDVNIAIIGRPNVGKSTLLNGLVGAERAIVSPEAGTTRDTVDTVIDRHGKTYRFLDTAGIRRKGKTKLIAEKLSVIMARNHLERADVAVLVVDASMGVTSHDATIASYAEQSGRSVIIAMNKWDLALQAAQEKAAREKAHGAAPSKGVSPAKLLSDYEPMVRGKLKFLAYAPIVFLSALTGERTEKLYTLIDRVVEARRRRISTGELNRWLANVDLERGTSPASREVKIYYITQATVAPPTFVLFTNQAKPLHFSYQRFLENRLRAAFDFTGTPIRFTQRLKKRDRPGFEKPEFPKGEKRSPRHSKPKRRPGRDRERERR
ncbi:MAG TPA: ribosome biogenesis GTPase Der [Candidatus Baltobacteraceae bacterium]|nr:ribosome biogenesis GTPase Der [Candidatus Baltobacteraceae bacterium]